MILRLELPDDLFSKYERMAETTNMGGRAASVNEVITSHLDRFSGVAPTERVIVVDSRSRDRLEKILGIPSLTTAPDLCNRVEKLASLKIGNIKVDFTSGQLAQLKNYAIRNKKPLSQVCEEVVSTMSMQFFDYTF